MYICIYVCVPVYSLSLKATDYVHYLWLLWMDTTSRQWNQQFLGNPWVLKFQPPCGRGQSFQRRSQPWHASFHCPTDFWTTYLQKSYNSTSSCVLFSEPKKSISKKKHAKKLHQLSGKKLLLDMPWATNPFVVKGLVSFPPFHSILVAPFKQKWENQPLPMVWDISMLQHWHKCSSLPMYRRW